MRLHNQHQRTFARLDALGPVMIEFGVIDVSTLVEPSTAR